MSQEQPMETTVKSYDNPKDYQKDLQKMSKGGWSVQSVLDHQNERSLAGKLFVPGGIFTNGKSQMCDVPRQRNRHKTDAERLVIQGTGALAYGSPEK